MKRAILSLLCLVSLQVVGSEGFYARIYGGASVLGNQDLSQSGFRGAGVTGESQASLGYRAGFSVGHYWNKNISSELTWDYITNTTETTFSDGSTFSDGDYSSRLHFLNTYYHFNSSGSWKPYVGAGIGIVEEVDVDFEDATGEQSFSDSGDLGYQIIIGGEYELKSNWAINIELTHIGFSGPSFEQESGSATINDDEGYSPWNINIGLKYSF